MWTVELHRQPLFWYRANVDGGVTSAASRAPHRFRVRRPSPPADSTVYVTWEQAGGGESAQSARRNSKNAEKTTETRERINPFEAFVVGLCRRASCTHSRIYF